MSVGMPELKAWQEWRVTMDGDIVEVGIYRLPEPEQTSSQYVPREFSRRIRFGTLDSYNFETEADLVAAIEQEAWRVFLEQERRGERREWIRKNFP